MSQTRTIRLLILNDSRAEAERLTSMLHNAGRPARAQYVESDEALNKLLQEKGWDLLIAHDETTNLVPQDAIRVIRRLNKDIPTILLTDKEGSHPVVEGMKMGAADVVRLDEDQHLLLVIERELNALEQREHRRFAERRHKEVERRNQQLLDSSRDAIAFVQDGMFLYANDSFAELLDHESRDDIECMPVIDVIAEADQAAVKKFLKEFTLKGSDVDTTALEFSALLADDSTRKLKVDVRKATYDEESCIQFVVRANVTDNEELEAQLAQIKNQDIATGLYNKAYLIDILDKEVNNAVNGVYNSALFHIGIDAFSETVQSKVGIASADLVVAQIAQYAAELMKKGDTLCRYSEDSFMVLIPKIDPQTAAQRAEKICQQLRDYIVDVDGSTMQFTYNIGISLINEISTKADIPIDHAHKALELARKSDDASVKIYEPESKKDTKKNIATKVQQALDQGKFKLLFQPILSLRGSEKEHYEVLLRMVGPDDDQEVSPTEFLSSAAEIGATTKIDRWVILESIKILSEHRSNGNNTQLLINLSRESMLDATLPPWLGVAFKAANLPKDSVIFQLNEIDVNDHLNVAADFTKKVAALGSQLSINRFGCALNPFKALETIKVQYIKIDGSFTQELQQNGEDTQTLNELVSQLHQLDMITIVPFVENASILSKLWQSGVHYIQGFYLQGPSEQMNYDFDMES